MVELSIVLVVLSVLLTGVISTRKIVENANIQSIMTDVWNIRSGITQFVGSYGTLPGMVQSEKIGGALKSPSSYYYPSMGGTYSSYIHTHNMLDAFKQLSRANLIEGIDTTVDQASLSTSTYNIKTAAIDELLPYASFSSQKAVWLLGNIMHPTTGAPFAPKEASVIPGWDNKSLRIILGSAIEERDELTSINAPAITSSMAYRLDLKFDDGKPLMGQILGNKAEDRWSTSDVCNSSNISLPGTTPDLSGTTYNRNSSSIQKGCIVSFMIDYPRDG